MAKSTKAAHGKYVDADNARPKITTKRAVRSTQRVTDLATKRYRLSEPLTISVQKSGDQYVATDANHGWYGYGETKGDAIGRFASGIVERLEGLKEREGELGDSMHSELKLLERIVVHR